MAESSLSAVIHSNILSHIELTNNAKINEAGSVKVGVLAQTETFAEYKADKVIDIGSSQDEEEIARHLYGALRDMDSEGIELIFSEEFDIGQIGQAIMNRLIKAAGHKIKEV